MMTRGSMASPAVVAMDGMIATMATRQMRSEYDTFLIIFYMGKGNSGTADWMALSNWMRLGQQGCPEVRHSNELRLSLSSERFLP